MRRPLWLKPKFWACVCGAPCGTRNFSSIVTGRQFELQKEWEYEVPQCTFGVRITRCFKESLGNGAKQNVARRARKKKKILARSARPDHTRLAQRAGYFSRPITQSGARSRAIKDGVGEVLIYTDVSAPTTSIVVYTYNTTNLFHHILGAIIFYFAKPFPNCSHLKD